MTDDPMPDIQPGWQEREAALRRLLKTCEHKSGRYVNTRGEKFCPDCGLILLT